MRVLGSGPIDAKICILVDFPRVSAAAEGKVFFGWEEELIHRRLLKANIHPNSVRFESIIPFCPKAKTYRTINPLELDTYIRDTKERLNRLRFLNIIVPLGNLALKEICGKTSIDKWQLSLLETVPSLNVRKAVPSFLPSRIMREYSLQIFLELAFNKAQREKDFPELKRTNPNIMINRTVDETISYLENLQHSDELSIDIETSRGRINTFGFASSPTEAIAIGILPSRFGIKTHKKIWDLIAGLCESDQPKILQNYIYETMYLSKYGFRLNNVHHDTMWAQKFLYPELKKGLDNVGRIYTNQPYWKEDNKNWNNIKDWDEHYLYNGKDTCFTYEGYLNQRDDLERRGLSDLFYKFVMQFAPAITEMCSRGLKISEENLRALQVETNTKIESLSGELLEITGLDKFNPKSNKQVKEYLKDKGYTLYKKYDSATKSYKESTNQTSLKKMRAKYPDCKEIPLLLQLSTLNKAKSSYLDIKYDKDSRMRYNLNGVGTETGRMCVISSTYVTTPKGLKQIKDIKPDDLVYSYNSDLHLVLNKVLWSGKTNTRVRVIKLNWKSHLGRTGSVVVTPCHQIRLRDGNYLRADKLVPGTKVCSLARYKDRNRIALTGINCKHIEHRIVYSTFNSDKPEVIHHKDLNPFNNDVSNLVGMSIKDHISLHAKLDGRIPSRQPCYIERARGSKIASAKLCEEQIVQVKKLLGQGLSQRQLGRIFNVSHSTIGMIARGKSWAHVEYNNHIITNIEPVSEFMDVYDLTIANDSNFIANEICIHNSGRADSWPTIPAIVISLIC